jgi:hypothetical protein
MRQRSNSILKYFVIVLLALAPLAQQANSADERIPVPEFVLEISLTDEADRKLEQAGESIKGTIYFDGDGSPLPDTKTAPFRDVFLGQHGFELEKAGTLTIKKASVSREAFSRLKDSNYHYVVNVYSGRRVFARNMLSGCHAYGRVDELKAGKRIEIRCGLLESPEKE